MCKNALEQCQSGNDFVVYAEKKGRKNKALGVWTRNGKGTHCIVGTILGQTVVPLHREIAKGLRCKLISTFIAIGLACLVILMVAI
jgi:hypothetical protein